MIKMHSQVVATLAGLLAGCVSSHATSTDWGLVDGAQVSSIAVARFENLTAEARAGHTMTAAVANELKRRNFDIRELGGTSGTIERWTASRLAKDAKTSAVLVGIVTAYEYRPGPQAGAAALVPTLALDVRLIGSEDGQVLWAAGYELNENQILSYDGVPLEQLTQDAAEQIADALEILRAGG